MNEKEKFLEVLKRADAAGDKDAVAKLKSVYDQKFGSGVSQSEEPYRQTEVTPVGAAIRGVGEGLTMGHGEYISAAGATAQDVLEGVVDTLQTGDAGSLPNIQEAYTKNLLAEKKLNQKAEIEHPWAHMGGDVAGTAIGERLFFGIGNKFGGAKYGNSISGYLSTHGLLGAAHGLGRSEEKTLEGKINDMLTGGALGVAGGSVGIAVGGKAVQKAAESSDNVSKQAFLSFLGIDKPFKFERQLQSKGKKLDEFAERLFNYTIPDSKDATKQMPLISRTDTKEEMFYKVEDAAKMAGRSMASIIDSIDGDAAVKKHLDSKGLYKKIVSEIFDGEDYLASQQQSLKQSLVGLGDEAAQGPVAKHMNPDDRKTHSQLQKFVYETFFDTPIIDKDGVITNAYTPHSDPSLRRMWEFSQGIRKKASEVTANKGLISMNMAEQQFFKGKVQVAKMVNKEMENAIEATGIVKKNPELYSQYAESRLKYGDLAETRDLLVNQLNKNPHSEWLHRLSKNAVFSSLSVVGGIGAVMGMPQAELMLAVAALNGVSQSPSVQGGVAKQAAKLANTFKSKPDKYAGAISTLLNSMNISSEAYHRDLSLISAEVNLREAPLARNSGSIMDSSADVLTLLQSENPALADDLRTAIEYAHKTADTSALTGIMSEVASIPKMKGIFQEGIGWDGRAVSEEDKATVESKLQKLSNRKRSTLIPKFRESGAIPDEFYEEDPKVRQTQIIYQKAKQKIRNRPY